MIRFIILCYYLWPYCYSSVNNLWMLPSSWVLTSRYSVWRKGLCDIHLHVNSIYLYFFLTMHSVVQTNSSKLNLWWSYMWLLFRFRQWNILVWVVLYPCRLLGFRKRAQSAEEENTTSLQHITLTEFLKEYVFTKMVSQPCMCGLTRSNPVFILQLIH